MTDNFPPPAPAPAPAVPPKPVAAALEALGGRLDTLAKQIGLLKTALSPVCAPEPPTAPCAPGSGAPKDLGGSALRRNLAQLSEDVATLNETVKALRDRLEI